MVTMVLSSNDSQSFKVLHCQWARKLWIEGMGYPLVIPLYYTAKLSLAKKVMSLDSASPLEGLGTLSERLEVI